MFLQLFSLSIFFYNIFQLFYNVNFFDVTNIRFIVDVS